MDEYDEWQNLHLFGKDAAHLSRAYVDIIPHEIPSLPEQSGIPSWDRQWIEPGLKGLIFGDDQGEPALKTYLIVDASRRKAVTKLFDLDTVDLPIRCLFKGDAEEDLKEAAPYLIDVTLPKDESAVSELELRFQRDFFTKHWGHNTGIFIRTDASMDEVWAHFRKFTKAVMKEDGRRVFFLFHDPRILPGYFSNIKDDAGKVRCFCSTDAGRYFRFIAEDGPDRAVEIIPDKTLLAMVPRPAFVLSYDDFRSQAEAEKIKRAGRMAARIQKDFPEELKSRNLEQLTDIAVQVVNRFIKYGFTKQEYLHYFVVWSVFLGVGFEDRDPQGELKGICTSDASEDDRFNHFKARVETIR